MDLKNITSRNCIRDILIELYFQQNFAVKECNVNIKSVSICFIVVKLSNIISERNDKTLLLDNFFILIGLILIFKNKYAWNYGIFINIKSH